MFYRSLCTGAPTEGAGVGRPPRDILLCIRRLPVLTLALSALGTCLTSGACGGDSKPSQPVLPQVVDVGGTFLASPKVLPILYASDPGATDILAFLQELATTSYWAQTTSEYGVGPLTVLPAIMLTDPAPKSVTDAMLESSVASNTSGANPAWGTADPSTIYLFVLPEGTIEADAEGACCTGYDGYHFQTDVRVGSGVVTVPYALSCACPGFDGPGITDLQERTIDMSHELVETATDPFPDSDPAYTQEDDDDMVWTLVTDGEVADMCEFNDDANVIPPGSTYMVQRSWSNAAAARFENPCVPVVTTTPYFNSFPRLGTISYDGGRLTTRGIKIPLGQSQTIDVALMSGATVAQEWGVSAYDYDDAILGATSGSTLRPPSFTGGDGATYRLTITPTGADSYLNGEAFIIWSDYGNPGDPDFESQLTMGLITN
jgi:hypothetical protein